MKHHLQNYLSATLMLLFFAVSLPAQDFSFTATKTKTTGKKVYSASVNDDAFISSLRKGNSYTVQLDGNMFTQEITSVKSLLNDYTGVSSRIPGSLVATNLLVKDGIVTGLFRLNKKKYKLSYHNEQYEFFEITEKVESCSVDETELEHSLHSKSTPGGPEATPSYNLEDYADTSTVDVLLLYTTAAKNWAKDSTTAIADMDELVALQETFKNDIIENSEIALKIRFVDALEIGDNSFTSESDMLSSLRNNTYPGEDIHNLQDSVGADLVALMEFYNLGGGGLGYRINDIGGNSESAYNINRVQQLYFTYTVMHEIGHNFGNSHGRTQESAAADELGGVFQFSTGHLLTTPADSFVTVMHYENLEGSDEAETIPYFSNPRVNYFDSNSSTNIATGAYDGDGGPSDNALSMSITKQWLSDYKDVVKDPPTISVSTATIADTVFPAGSSKQQLVISNTGNSDLQVRLDGEMEFSSALSKTNIEDIKQPVSISYGFESSEGFDVGSYTGHNNWISLNSAEPFEISTEQAASGTQSLKLSTANGSPFLNSPFFGTSANYTSYKMSFKIYLEGNPSFIARFASTFSDTYAGAVWFQNDTDILYYQGSTDNYWNFSDDYVEDSWYTVNIEHTPNDLDGITYNIGGSDRTRESISASPQNMTLSLSSGTDDVVYIDDIQITVEDSYGPGLAINDGKITIPAGATDTVDVEFFGNNYDDGNYTGNLYLETNDPNNKSLTVPLELTIDPNNAATSGSFALELTGQEGFRMLSSPVNVALKDFLEPLFTQGATNADTTGGSPNVWLWDNTFDGSTNSGWNAVADLADTLDAGEAVLVYVFDQSDLSDSTSTGFPKTLPIEGNLVTGITPTMNTNADGFTNVGNPYPTTIDWDNVSRTDMTAAIYVWSPNDNSWKTYNSGVGEITDGLVKPFQGFFVQTSSSPSTPSLTIDSGDKSTGGDFIGKEESQKVVRFQVESSSEGLSNSAFLSFRNDASTEKDDFDALEMNSYSGEYIQIASKSSDDVLLDINAMPLNENQDSFIIPITIESGHLTEAKFSISDFEGLSNYDVYLVKNGNEQLVEIGKPYAVDVNVKAKRKTLEPAPLVSESSDNEYSLKFVRNGPVSNEPTDTPTTYNLEQNYPNPFNPSTTIKYSVGEAGPVSITVYNVMGQKVADLVNETRNAGRYQVTWNATAQASGIYYYRLTAPGQTITRQMTLIK